MLLIPRREEEGDRFPCCPLGQPPKVFYLVPYHKLVPVAARNRIPLLRITVKPFAQGRGRGEIPSPLVYPSSDPFNPLRPDAINEDPDSICQFRRVIHALDLDHIVLGSWSDPVQTRKERPSFLLDGLSCFGPLMEAMPSHVPPAPAVLLDASPASRKPAQPRTGSRRSRTPPDNCGRRQTSSRRSSGR